MKSRLFAFLILALAVALSAQFVNTSEAAPGYAAQQITPTPGQVLQPGQVVRVSWKSNLPRVQYIDSCEMEVRMSVDGGNTYPWRISPYLGPKATSFNWTVPNLPTNAAVLDIRFGCEPQYPESFSPQPTSTFVIANVPGDN